MYHAGLFGGIRIFDLAASLNNIPTLFNSEINEYSIAVGKKYYTGHELGDIQTACFSRYRGLVKFLTGGFPCQDISISGKKAGIDGAKSGLWRQFYRAISEIHPEYVIIENSEQLANKGLCTVLSDLAEVGYHAEWCVISAAEMGASHIRKRLWILAYPNGKRRAGILHLLKRALYEKKSTQNYPTLDNDSNAFLRFSESHGQPAIFREYDGLSARLHTSKRLEAVGNAIYWPIPYLIIKTVIEVENLSDHEWFTINQLIIESC